MRDILELCKIWWRYVFLPRFRKNHTDLTRGGTSASEPNQEFPAVGRRLILPPEQIGEFDESKQLG
jgi:hypothetical protein